MEEGTGGVGMGVMLFTLKQLPGKWGPLRGLCKYQSVNAFCAMQFVYAGLLGGR